MDTTNRIIVDLYRSARESPVREFQERSLAAFGHACRFDSALCGTAKLHAGGLTYQSLELHNISDEFVPAHADIADEDILADAIAGSGGQVCAFTMRELMPAREYPRVASFDARFELQNVLGQMSFDPVAETLTGILLWRSKEHDRFSEEERRLGEVLIPHLVEASTVNRINWLNELTASTIARRGIRALANERGVLHTFDRNFLDLLHMEWPDWSPPTLPKALLDGLQSSHHRRFAGAHITVSADTSHGMLFLLARAKAAALGLTPAQLTVARLIAEGLSYKEAAGRLGVSVATVRNHLQAAYNVLGVRSKSALTRLLSGGIRDN